MGSAFSQAAPTRRSAPMGTQPGEDTLTSSPPSTGMSQPHLPPEICDYVVDLLQGESFTLEKCCLVSKSWVPRVRNHLFRRIAFHSLTHLKAWMRAFPDPDNSLACYTRALFIGCAKIISTTVVEGNGWMRAFSKVVTLDIWDSSSKRTSIGFYSRLLTGSRISPCRRSTLSCLASFQLHLFPTHSRGPICEGSRNHQQHILQAFNLTTLDRVFST
jgi:hypothetical protein